MHNLTYDPRLPAAPAPILLVGAGGIARDAHLPAYQKAGLPVRGVCDRSKAKAEALAADFSVPRAFDSLDAALAEAPEDTVYDLALPASAFAEVLGRLPAGAHVLIQKPMGESIGEARKILQVCRERELHAAVNCQLRYAPFVTAARRLIAEGAIGDLIDLEMRLTVTTPWDLFPFLEDRPRVEMLYHSVHYVDLIRSFLGDPRGVMARTVGHPDHPRLASVRSSILLDYPDPLRATVTTNHLHKFGPGHQESYLKWEGTRGAVKARIGLLMNYPRGADDRFEYCRLDNTEPNKAPRWEPMEIEGSWFPDAFVGTMAAVQAHKAALDAGDEPAPMPCDVHDVFHTMACLEAAYESDRRGGVTPDFKTETST